MNPIPANSAIAIIPARGGSKGIPQKNIQMLCGKPLIAWTIEAALEVTRIQRVIVSTDDSQIAKTARTYGAEVVMRPDSLSTDACSSEAALLHVLRIIESEEDRLPELTVFLQCTAPLIQPQDIDGTIALLDQEDVHTAIAGALFHYFLWQKDSEGHYVGVNHNSKTRLLRQDNHTQFLEAGSVYAMRTKEFCEVKHRFFGKTLVHEIPEERCWEIDTWTDLKVAEVLLREELNKQQI